MFVLMLLDSSQEWLVLEITRLILPMFCYSYYAKLKKDEEERQKELAQKYRDRVRCHLDDSNNLIHHSVKLYISNTALTSFFILGGTLKKSYRNFPVAAFSLICTMLKIPLSLKKIILEWGGFFLNH